MSRDLTNQTNLPFPSAEGGVTDTGSKADRIKASAYINIKLKTKSGVLNLSRYGFAVEDAKLAKLMGEKLDSLPSDEARAEWLAKCLVMTFAAVTERKDTTELTVDDLL